MTWCADGFEAAFDGLCRRFAAAAFPEPPDGFTAVSPPRPMRAVLRGTVQTSKGPTTVVVKWHRAVRVGDHVSKRVRGSKGEREGKVLRALAEAGVRVPQVLGYGDTPDICVTAFRDDLVLLPEKPDRDIVLDVAAQLGKALAAGLSARDLHPGNLAWSSAGAVVVDLGSASIDPDKDVVLTLAHWRYGLAQGLGYSARYRALRTLLAAAGRDPAEARTLAPKIEARARVVAARHRRGRDRRVRRHGKHFERLTDVPGLRAALRRRAWRGPGIEAARALLGPIEGARPLKADGSVVWVERDGCAFVVKHYAAPNAKAPRPLRSFGRAFAMENRRVPVARAQLALVASDGSGVLVSDLIPGWDLHEWFYDHGRGFTALPFRRRRAALEALGRMLRAMHDAGMFHRDLKAPNIVWTDDGSLAGTFTIVDHDGARVTRGDVPWKRRARDLARLDASLLAPRTDRLRVLRAYRRVWPAPPVDERTMVAGIEKYVRRKRGPAGRPR